MGYPSSHLYTVSIVSFLDTNCFFDIEYFFIHRENVLSSWFEGKRTRQYSQSRFALVTFLHGAPRPQYDENGAKITL